MDTTPEYIKMCEKAEEIQKLKDKWEDGDCIWDDEVVCWCDCLYEEEDVPEVGMVPWLPRQDQLQTMLNWNDYQLIARFSEFVHQQAGEAKTFYTSLEQLWLAFVMQEKFGKAWNTTKGEWA